MSSGEVVCWGYNGQGQTDTPPDLGTVVRLSSGTYHNCIVNTAGELRCWGDDTHGQTEIPEMPIRGGFIDAPFGYSRTGDTTFSPLCAANESYGLLWATPPTPHSTPTLGCN